MVGLSQVHGVGVFASREIAPGSRLIRIEGTLRRRRYDENYSVGGCWYAVGRQQWLDPGPHHAASFINHCCRANARWADDGYIVARRPIATGEELCIDYATTELDPAWRMTCTCRGEECRLVIRAADLEPRVLRTRLAEATPSFLRRHWRISR